MGKTHENVVTDRKEQRCTITEWRKIPRQYIPPDKFWTHRNFRRFTLAKMLCLQILRLLLVASAKL